MPSVSDVEPSEGGGNKGSPEPESTPGTAAPEATRERVVRVAAQLFAERGFDGTPVQELSDLAGVGRGALYYHIKSKQDVLFDIVRGRYERTYERAEKIVNGTGDVVARLTHLAEDMAVDVAASRNEWTVSLRDSSSLDDDKRELVIALRARYENLWGQLLDEGSEAGIFRPVTPVMRRGILQMFNGLSLWMEATGPNSPQEVAGQYLTMILDGIKVRTG
jgi:AcrR family transcriptional regulator